MVLAMTAGTWLLTDFRWSATALSESYFYSNMSPQLPVFNRQSWAKVEDMLRSYVDSRELN